MAGCCNKSRILLIERPGTNFIEILILIQIFSFKKMFEDVACEMAAISLNVLIANSDRILTHWGRVTHICVSKITIIGSDNGLSPGRRQAIIWTSAGILLNGPFGINSIEILIDIRTFSFTKMHLKMSAKWRPFCLGLNVLTATVRYSAKIYYTETDRSYGATNVNFKRHCRMGDIHLKLVCFCLFISVRIR